METHKTPNHYEAAAIWSESGIRPTILDDWEYDNWTAIFEFPKDETIAALATDWGRGLFMVNAVDHSMKVRDLLKMIKQRRDTLKYNKKGKNGSSICFGL